MTWGIGLLMVVLGAGLMVFKSTRNSSGVELSQAELLERMKTSEPLLVLDVRTEREYRSGHIPGALNLEVQSLSDSLSRLEPHRSKTLVVTCEHGIRARSALQMLQQAGFENLLHLTGDMAAWRKAKLEMVTV